MTEIARQRRCLAKHQTLILPEHMRALRTMRTEVQLEPRPAAEAFVEERELSVYDRIANAG